MSEVMIRSSSRSSDTTPGLPPVEFNCGNRGDYRYAVEGFQSVWSPDLGPVRRGENESARHGHGLRPPDR